MACCGKGGGQQSAPQIDPLAASQSARVGYVTTELPGVDESLWLWLKYEGPKQGSFTKISRATQLTYFIRGAGHVFPIHRKDEMMFKTVRDRFAAVQDPRKTMTETPPPPRRRPTIVEARPPQLSTIVRPDPIAAGQRDFAVQARQEPEQSPPPPQTVPTLASLNLGITVTKALEEAGYTVDKLTKATVGDLMEVKGIGRVTARKILDAVNIAVA